MAKKAVLIGINRYRIPGGDLRGCVNDVQNIQSVLMEHFGFAKGDITMLTDLSATTAAMRKAIAGLVASGKKGDTLYLHYSGHGSNVPDKDGDEKRTKKGDVRDEILCPADLDWNDPLLDDWLRTTFNKVKAGVNLTVVFDCCHSGTATRAPRPPDAPIIPRYLPSPFELIDAESGRKPRGKLTSKLKIGKGKKDVVVADIGELLLTGCRDVQTSADAYIGGSYNGALTYYLASVLRAAKGKLTYRELHERVLKQLSVNDYDQVPQLEGSKANLDRPFLGPLS